MNQTYTKEEWAEVEKNFNRHALVRSTGEFRIFSSKEDAEASRIPSRDERYVYLDHPHIGAQWQDPAIPPTCECGLCWMSRGPGVP